MKRLPERCLMLVTEPVDALAFHCRSGRGGRRGHRAVARQPQKHRQTQQVLGSLSAVTKDRAILIANGDWEANVRAGAQGHSSAGAVSPGRRRAVPRRKRRADREIGAFRGAARQAEGDGADYLIAGTIFASQSHPEIAPAGVEFLRQVCEAVSIPVLAIGGVTPENVGECIEAGRGGRGRAVADHAGRRPARRRAGSIGRRWTPPGRNEHATDRQRRAAQSADAATLAEFLTSLDLRSQMVVVERNGEIVPRGQYAETPLTDGDVLEIVQMMAGG